MIYQSIPSVHRVNDEYCTVSTVVVEEPSSIVAVPALEIVTLAVPNRLTCTLYPELLATVGRVIVTALAPLSTR